MTFKDALCLHKAENLNRPISDNLIVCPFLGFNSNAAVYASHIIWWCLDPMVHVLMCIKYCSITVNVHMQTSA